MGTAEADISFVTGRGQCVKKTIAWKIENFSEFLKMSNEELEENGIVFEAGNCARNDGSRTPAKWKYYFKHTIADHEVDWVGGFLKAEFEAASIVNSKAWCSVSLSSGGQPIRTPSFPSERIELDGTSAWGCRKLITESDILEATEEDTLDVTLKVFSTHSFKPFEKTPSSLSDVRLRIQADSDFVKMFSSGDGADVEIKVPSEVGGEVDEFSYAIETHKGILMARSSVFSKMFAKESTMTEAQTGKVVIKDLSPKGLNIFLYYLYTGKVLDGWVHIVSELVNAAEKYDCGDLKQYCGDNILNAVSTTNALELYKLTKLHGLLDAAKRVLGFISMNTATVIDQVVEENK